MITERRPRFTRGLPVGVGGGVKDSPAMALGRVYQRAARRLGQSELRGFLLHQAEWLVYTERWDPVDVQAYVDQAAEYLRNLLSLNPRPRRRVPVSPMPRLVDKE